MTRFWNVPNVISLLRIPLAAAVWIDPRNQPLLLGLLTAAVVSDLLDGWLARRSGSEGASEIGAWLDPVCDKVFILSAAAAVAWAWRLPPALLLLTATREALQIPLYGLFRFIPRLRPRTFDFRAAKVGKATTVVQMATITAMIVLPDGAPALAVVSAVLGAASVTVYVRRAIRSRQISPGVLP